MKHTVLAVFTIIGLFARSVNAAPITSTETSNNLITFEFTLPVQPASYDALFFYPDSSSSFGTFDAVTSLYEGSTLLGTSTINDTPSARFSAATSVYASVGAIVDYTQIADGIVSGKLVMQLVGSSFTLNWDPSLQILMGAGDGGSSAGYAGSITSVTVATATAPEPSLMLLLASGLVGCSMRRLRTRRA